MKVKEGITACCYGADYYHIRVIKNKIHVGRTDKSMWFNEMDSELYEENYSEDRLVIPKELI